MRFVLLVLAWEGKKKVLLSRAGNPGENRIRLSRIQEEKVTPSYTLQSCHRQTYSVFGNYRVRLAVHHPQSLSGISFLISVAVTAYIHSFTLTFHR